MTHNNRPIENPLGYGPKFFKSKAELAYARCLELLRQQKSCLKDDWKYEPTVFEFPVKKGTKTYRPDFWVTDTFGDFYAEVKTSLTQKDITKFHRMAIHHPNIKLVLMMTRLPRKGKQAELVAKARQYVYRISEITKI